LLWESLHFGYSPEASHPTASGGAPGHWKIVSEQIR
jgi:hypothetical protein